MFKIDIIPNKIIKSGELYKNTLRWLPYWIHDDSVSKIMLLGLH